MIAIWAYTIRQFAPITAEIKVNDITQNENLPSNDGVVTMYLDNEILTDTIDLQAGKANFKRIPYHRLGNDVGIKVSFRDFFEIDTVLSLSKAITLNIKRNPDVYGHIHFALWNPENESFVPNCEIIISDKVKNEHREIVRGMTDSNGLFEIEIPLPQQKISYGVSSPTIGLESNIIYMPCGKNDVILIKN